MSGSIVDDLKRWGEAFFVSAIIHTASTAITPRRLRSLERAHGFVATAYSQCTISRW